MAGEALARIIKTQSTHPSELTDILFGKVTSTSPLTITLSNGLPIPSELLILSKMVRDYKVTDDKGVGVQVFRALKTGDNVSLIRISQGKQYYVLEVI